MCLAVWAVEEIPLNPPFAKGDLRGRAFKCNLVVQQTPAFHLGGLFLRARPWKLRHVVPGWFPSLAKEGTGEIWAAPTQRHALRPRPRSRGI